MTYDLDFHTRVHVPPRLKALLLSSLPGYFLFSVLLAGVLLTGVSGGQTVDRNLVAINYRSVATGTGSISSIERNVFDRVNDERIKEGRQPLVWIESAAAAARSHSRNMAEFDYLSHSDLIGNRVDDRATKFGLKDWRWLGENIAWLSGYSDPVSRVVVCWMRSPGHRANILQPKYREAGVGLSISADGKYYFTQVFVLRK